MTSWQIPSQQTGGSHDPKRENFLTVYGQSSVAVDG